MKRGLALGLTVAPGVGLVSGFVGAGKIQLTCLKCGHRFRPGESKKVAEVCSALEVGSHVRRTLNGTVGEVTAIDGDAVTVRWADNRTSIHLASDLKPEKAAGVRLALEMGLHVRRALSGAIGEVVAVDGAAVTVRWADNRTSIHLASDLKPAEPSA